MPIRCRWPPENSWILFHIRSTQPDTLQHTYHFFLAILRRAYPVNQQPFTDDLPDFHARIEGSKRVLKHHLQMPSYRPEPRAIQRCQILVFEQHLPCIEGQQL